MSLKYWLPLVALLCLPTPALAAHSGLASTDPSTADDEHFVVDQAPGGLDTGCTFRESGPLKFKVGINRYVGEANKDDSLLANIETLKKEGVISHSVKLRMPAFDIDDDRGEVDDVYFNGHKVGTLKGANDAWQENEFGVAERVMN